MEEGGKGKGAREEEEETGFCSTSKSLLREDNKWKVVETDEWIRSQRSVVNYGPSEYRCSISYENPDESPPPPPPPSLSVFIPCQ